MQLIINGRTTPQPDGTVKGKMPQALRDYCTEHGIEFFDFEPGFSSSFGSNIVAVHFDTQEQLDPFIEFCQQHSVPLICGSTGQKLPDTVSIPVMDAPNLAIPIIQFLEILDQVHRVLLGMDVRIAESHQATKTSVPGTAKVMATTLGVPIEEIISVREPAVQLRLGIAQEHLDGHGHHLITLIRDGVAIELNTRINGREPYCAGAVRLAQGILEHRTSLKNRIYEPKDWLKFI